MAIEAIIYSAEADVFETSTASYKIKDYGLQLSFHNEGKKHISSRCEGFVILEILR